MSYTAPGVYIKQKMVAGGVTQGASVVPCIIGKGINTKRVWGETVVRGQVIEVVVPDPITREFLLSNVSTQKLSESVLIKDGVTLGTDAYTFSDASTVIVDTHYYNEASVYSFKYISSEVTADTLTYTSTGIRFVSYNPDGSRIYKSGTDWQLQNSSDIDWSIITKVSITSDSGTFNLSSKAKIKISVDGKTPVEVTITGNSMSAVTGAEVASSINSACSSAWGSAYANVAAAVDYGAFTISSVLIGESARINFYIPSSGDATNILMGNSHTAPFYVQGVGNKPALGSSYYVSYDMARPASDYNTVKLYFGFDEIFNDRGPMIPDNDILIAAQIMFQNGAKYLGVIQVQDSDSDGIYMDYDWGVAIDALKNNSTVTDPVLLCTAVNPYNYLVRVIEEEAAQTKDHWMGGWFGFDNSNGMGNIDTPASWIYTAYNQLQVSGDSQGRGRYVAVAASTIGIAYTILNTDTKQNVTLSLDSPFVAAAVLGVQMSFSNISDSLLRKSVIGFDAATFDITESQAAYLAEYGVTAIINKGGALIVFDPVTTDHGGDPVFSEINIRYEKDYLAYTIRNRLDNYVIGVTPDDAAEFALNLKYHIAAVIKSAINDHIIAPFQDDGGLTRDIDLSSDIKAYQDTVNKTQYRFSYWFVEKYTCKRVYGEYVVGRQLL